MMLYSDYSMKTVQIGANTLIKLNFKLKVNLNGTGYIVAKIAATEKSYVKKKFSLSTYPIFLGVY